MTKEMRWRICQEAEENEEGHAAEQRWGVKLRVSRIRVICDQKWRVQQQWESTLSQECPGSHVLEAPAVVGKKNTTKSNGQRIFLKTSIPPLFWLSSM